MSSSAQGHTRPEVLGLIAGGGRFPQLIAAAAREAGMTVVAAGFPDDTDPAMADAAHVYQRLKIGQLGKLIAHFKRHRVDAVIMAGTINKPRAMHAVPDWRGAKLVFSLKERGDDAILRAAMAEFETEGMPVLPAHELLPELLTPAGVLAGHPDEDVMADVRFGWRVAREMGRLDIGQTVVVRGGIVAAVEALEGTDAAIERGCALAGPGAVVVKVCKPGQDARVDLPSLGTGTVGAVVRGKGAALAVHAGRSLFFERETALAQAMAAGLCVIGVDDTDSAGEPPVEGMSGPA